MDTGCSKEIQNKKAECVRKRRKRNTVVPLTTANCEISLVVKVTSSTCENDTLDSMMPPDIENGEEKQEKRDGNCIFRSILVIALMIGVPISPSMRFPGRKYLIHFLKIWNRSVFLIRTTFFIIECFYNHCFWPSLAQRYSIHGSCLAGYLMMIIFHVKRRELEEALWKLTRLSSELHPPTLHPLIRCYEFICFSCCISYLTLGVYFLWVIWWDFTFQKIVSAYPLQESTSFNYYLVWVVNLAEIFTYHIGAATLFATTVLCSQSYLASKEFVRLFGKKLKKDVSERAVDTTTTSRSLQLFNRIFSCVGTLDDVFGICAVVIYMDVINNYYVVLSTLLSRQEKYGSVEVLTIMGIITTGATLKFLYLTLSGDCLKRQHFALMNDLIEMSENVVRKSSKLGIHRFTTITANVRTVGIHVTGMGYFKITRVIIPSALSMLITYGVTIYQIGAINDLYYGTI